VSRGIILWCSNESRFTGHEQVPVWTVDDTLLAFLGRGVSLAVWS